MLARHREYYIQAVDSQLQADKLTAEHNRHLQELHSSPAEIGPPLLGPAPVSVICSSAWSGQVRRQWLIATLNRIGLFTSGVGYNEAYSA